MSKKNNSLFYTIGFITAFSLPLCANNQSFNTYTANNGTSGIFQTPNARIIPDWSMKLFANKSKPNSFYGFVLTPLPHIETKVHFIKNDNTEENTQDEYKKKAISLKVLLKKEGIYTPALSYGIDDFWGDAIYTSKYLVASKRIKYLDLSLGYAKGFLASEKLDKNINKKAIDFIKDDSLSDGEFFGSVVLDATPKISVMAEYLNDTVNFGTKYNLNNQTTLSLSFEDNDTFAFGVSYKFGLSKNAFIKHKEDSFKVDEKVKNEYNSYNQNEFKNNLAKEISQNNFSNVQTSVNKNSIYLELENTQYNNDLNAVGKALSIVNELAPSNYDTIYTTLKNTKLAHKTFKVNRAEFDLYKNNQVSDDYMREAIVISNDTKSLYEEFTKNNDSKEELKKSDLFAQNNFSYFIGPDIDTFVNDAQDNLYTKASLQIDTRYNISNGMFIHSNIKQPVFNEIKDLPNLANETNLLASNHSLIDYYKYNDTQLQTLTFDYLKKTAYNSYAKIETGYFDYAYAGVDLQWHKSFLDDRLGLGLQYQYVYKRKLNNMLKIYDDNSFDAKFLNLYYLLSPKYNIHLGLKAGEFLGNDKGVKINLARHYKGFTIGAYATFTNSDKYFTSEDNKNYTNKGVFVRIPLEIFTNRSLKAKANYNISKSTRETGQYAKTSYDLDSIINSENNIKVMKRQIRNLEE